MKRISTIRLLTELSKFGKLSLEGCDPLDNCDKRFYCVYEPREVYKCEYSTLYIEQSTDDIISFLRIAAAEFNEGFNPIFDKVIDSLI